MTLTSQRYRRSDLATGYRQRGAMAISMMLMMIGLIAMLGLVEIGYLYWAKRDTQKVADMAALSGAQQLGTCNAGNTNNAAAQGNAITDNGFNGANEAVVIACGTWDPTANAAPEYFAKPATGVTPNAVMVAADRPVLPIWGFAGALPTIHTVAIAANTAPTAAFSVGSSLLSVNPAAPLGQLLDSALGASLGLQLLSYNGIANTNISLLGLKNLLPISAGTLTGVLNAPITVNDFLGAYVQLLQQQSANTASIDITFVEQQVALIEAQLGDVQINLGQILNVNANTQDPNSALNTTVSALGILNAVVQAADSANAVAIPAANITVPGIATVNLSLSVIEPPQIGVGGVGTTAHTAEIRLLLNVSVLNNALTGNESLIGVPLYLEVAPTDATITNITCNVPGAGGALEDNVTIGVAPGVLNAFLGNLSPAAFTNTTTTWPTLISSGSMAALVRVELSVLGIVVPVATINAMANVQVATTPAGALVFDYNPSLPISQQANMTQTLTPNPPMVLGTVLTSLLSSTSLQTGVTLLGGNTGLNLGPLLSGLTGLLQPVLTPLFTALDTALVGPLLQLTGVDIGNADVTLQSVNCNAGAQLVY